ncbi:hypothetical protein NMY22_g19977 [Coprinellus aureogranulatus]|nr:hypothetical protein NMY22_g19977 [Coprinellus aureogranulatus]
MATKRLHTAPASFHLPYGANLSLRLLPLPPLTTLPSSPPPHSYAHAGNPNPNPNVLEHHYTVNTKAQEHQHRSDSRVSFDSRISIDYVGNDADWNASRDYRSRDDEGEYSVRDRSSRDRERERGDRDRERGDRDRDRGDRGDRDRERGERERDRERTRAPSANRETQSATPNPSHRTLRHLLLTPPPHPILPLPTPPHPHPLQLQLQ